MNIYLGKRKFPWGDARRAVKRPRTSSARGTEKYTLHARVGEKSVSSSDSLQTTALHFTALHFKTQTPPVSIKVAGCVSSQSR